MIFVTCFGMKVFAVDGGVTNTTQSLELKTMGELKYYLYTPENPTENMPLIIYLHGGTNKREDVTSLLTTDGFPKYLNEGYYGDLRAYVAVPKLENSYKGWVDIYEQIRTLIRVLKTNYSIDENKIALTGHSMGGTGTYQLQLKMPNIFACIAPMSGSVQNTEANITALSKTKIWAFVGTADTIVDPASSRLIINTLQESGANAQITELDDATHFDVPSLAYKNDTLIQWLVNGGEIPVGYLRGNVNCDGYVTITDVTHIQRKLVQLPIDGFNDKAADVDGDGLNITDATNIQRFLAEFEDPYNIGTMIYD